MNKITSIDEYKSNQASTAILDSVNKNLSYYSPEDLVNGEKLVRDKLKEIAPALKKAGQSAAIKDYEKRIDNAINNIAKDSYKQAIEVLAKIYNDINANDVAQRLSQVAHDRAAQIAAFNEKHAAVLFGKKFAVYREEEMDFVPPEEMAKLYKYWNVTDAADKTENIVSAWMGEANIKRYGDIVFDPTKPFEPTDKYFNVFRGWAVTPEEGDDDAPFWELLFAMCGNHDPYIDFVSKWIADIFQRPASNPGVAIGIQAKQGVGKSAFIETIAALIAIHPSKQKNRGRPIKGPYLKINTFKSLFSDYNEELAFKLLIFLDEATWGGRHDDASQLKTLITQQEETINPKFLGKITLPCYRRFMLASNSTFYYRADKDDRRLLPLEPDTSVINGSNTEFWNRFWDKFHNGKMLENLLDKLLKINLTGWQAIEQIKLLDIVTGAALMEHSKSDFDQWVEQAVEDDEIIIKNENGQEESIGLQGSRIKERDLENAWWLYSQRSKSTGKWYNSDFKHLRNVVFGEIKKVTIEGKQTKVRNLGSQQSMLEAIDKQYRWKTAKGEK